MIHQAELFPLRDLDLLDYLGHELLHGLDCKANLHHPLQKKVVENSEAEHNTHPDKPPVADVKGVGKGQRKA